MSIYQLFYSFWEMCFVGAEQTAIETWVPMFSMLTVVAIVFGIFLTVAKIFK